MPAGDDERRGVALSDRQRLSWLRLIRSDNVGPATFRDLINHFGSAETAIEQLPELSRRGGSARAIKVASVADAEAELEAARKFGAVFIGMANRNYPPGSGGSNGAPPLIRALAKLSELATQVSVGIVGADTIMRAPRRWRRGMGARGRGVWPMASPQWPRH